jgi:hypothetical protein
MSVSSTPPIRRIENAGKSKLVRISAECARRTLSFENAKKSEVMRVIAECALTGKRREHFPGDAFASS